MEDLNIRHGTVKSLQENTEENIPDIGLGNYFLELTGNNRGSRTKTKKNKNQKNKKQMRLYKTKTRLQNKETNHYSKKAIYGMGQNLCKAFI